MYYSLIGLLAVLMLFIENRDILRSVGVSHNRAAWKAYRRFLFAVLVYYITDILWGVLENRRLSALLFADTTVYYVAMAMGVLFWAQYTVSYLNEDRAFGRFLVYTALGTSGLLTLLSVVNIFVPVLFTVDSACVYHAMPMRYVMLALQVLLLLLITLYSLSSIHRMGEVGERAQRYRTLGGFGLIMAALLFAQLWFPFLPLYTIAYMLGTSMLHTFVAIDEREEYRRELEESEKVSELTRTITSLLDNMPGMTFTKDAETGVYLACNQAFAEYAQKGHPGEVTGHTAAELFDAETAGRSLEDDRVTLSLSKPYVFYEDMSDAAGNKRQLQTTKLKYRDTNGRVCILGVCQDVTDFVRVQRENDMTKEAYEKAVSSGLITAHIAQTLARDYSDLFYVNTDSEEFIEYRRENQSGSLSELRRGWHFFSDCKLELSEKVCPEDRDSFLQAMNRRTLMESLSQKNTFIMTYRQLSSSGPIYVSMKVSLMDDDEHFIIVGMTNVNAEMRDAMAKSEALAEALTAAEEANKARTSFLTGMSHEIRTPMNAIIGLNTLALKKQNLDAETRGYLEKIQGSARHLLALINDILEMSRIESGRVLLHREAFSLSRMLEQINTVYLSQCSEKGVTYECHVLTPVDEAYIGDDQKLRQVLNNILSNAVKFTDAPGSVTLSLERTALFGDQSTLCFRIKDTGIGMEQSYLPRVFDTFSQEDSSSKTKYGSTGLGMAITKRLVEMMNGSVSVASEKGAGSEFTVTLTLRNCDQKVAQKDYVIDCQALHVLVVDDDPIETEHARTVLSDVGIQADTCTSGQEALRMMALQHTRHTPYNLVLMDWYMPGMNGLEASAEIRKQFDDESTVVVLTAYNWDDIQEEAQRVGVDSFLSKPLLSDTVIDRLEQIARRNKLDLFKEKKQANLTGRRILLAEDMAINAEILIDTLELESIKADHAENGKIAVEMFQRSAPGTYAAVLMDVRMPEMDGLEASAAIRALPREDAKQIPIIALTANAFDEDVQRSLQAGMNAHLTKPVEAEQLIQVLGELIYEAENSRSSPVT